MVWCIDNITLLDYFDETLEKFSALNKPIFIMGDFNINLIAVETCNYAYKFLLSLQSNSLIPTVDKPARVYNNSATLIDNIFVNKLDSKIKRTRQYKSFFLYILQQGKQSRR